MDFVYIVFGLFFTIFGLMFSYGKILPYLKAWQNMSEKEKAGIKVNLLCMNIGLMIILAGLIFFFRGLIPGFSQTLFISLIVVWFIASGLDCYWIEKSAHYETAPEFRRTDKNAKRHIGTSRRKDL